MTTKGEETRRTILGNALDLASREGLEALSIGDLAKEVGMSKSGLYAHFDSKEDLQVQILEAGIDRFVELVVAPALRAPRGRPRIEALFEAWLEWTETLSGGCPFVAAASELDDKPGPARDRLAAAQKDWLGTLATAARIAREEGHFHDDVDPEQFAYEMNGILLAHHHNQRLIRDPDSRRRAETSFRSLLAASARRDPKP